MYKKLRSLTALAILFFLSGLDKQGFLFDKMIGTCIPPLVNLTGAYIAGIVIAPMLLPWVPFRAFSLKGAFWGVMTTLLLSSIFHSSLTEALAFGLMNVAVASFMTMNFTGSSTFTSLSGVKKEMKWALPFQIGFAAVGLILFILTKLI